MAATRGRQAPTLAGGSDRDRFRECILPPGALVFASVPERRRVGHSHRDAYQTAHRQKLSPQQEAAIKADAGRRTLRDLAAEFGVSHETIRKVLRAAGWAGAVA